MFPRTLNLLSHRLLQSALVDSSAMHQSNSQLGLDPPLTSEHTGKDSSTLKHQSTNQLRSDRHRPESSSPKRTGTDSSATKHQSTSQLRSDGHRPGFSSRKRTGSDSSATKHKLTSQFHSDRHRPRSTKHTGTNYSATRYCTPASFNVTDLRPTDLSLQFTPTPTLLFYTDRERTVPLVSVQRPVVTYM